MNFVKNRNKIVLMISLIILFTIIPCASAPAKIVNKPYKTVYRQIRKYKNKTYRCDQLKKNKIAYLNSMGFWDNYRFNDGSGETYMLIHPILYVSKKGNKTAVNLKIRTVMMQAEFYDFTSKRLIGDYFNIMGEDAGGYLYLKPHTKKNDKYIENGIQFRTYIGEAMLDEYEIEEFNDILNDNREIMVKAHCKDGAYQYFTLKTRKLKSWKKLIDVYYSIK